MVCEELLPVSEFTGTLGFAGQKRKLSPSSTMVLPIPKASMPIPSSGCLLPAG